MSEARSLYDLIPSRSNHSACCWSCRLLTNRRSIPGLDLLSGFGVDSYGGNPGNIRDTELCFNEMLLHGIRWQNYICVTFLLKWIFIFFSRSIYWSMRHMTLNMNINTRSPGSGQHVIFITIKGRGHNEVIKKMPQPCQNVSRRKFIQEMLIYNIM